MLHKTAVQFPPHRCRTLDESDYWKKEGFYNGLQQCDITASI